jgi:hypothetical protein
MSKQILLLQSGDVLPLYLRSDLTTFFSKLSNLADDLHAACFQQG